MFRRNAIGTGTTSKAHGEPPRQTHRAQLRRAVAGGADGRLLGARGGSRGAGKPQDIRKAQDHESRRQGRARAPGWGEVDWPKFISALIEVGYEGNIDIEHEDDVFAAAAVGKVEHEAEIVAKYSEERNGLRLGYNTLRNLIVKEKRA